MLWAIFFFINLAQLISASHEADSCHLPGYCYCEMGSWGYGDTNPTSYIKINGESVFTGDTATSIYRGIYLVILNPYTCTAYNHKYFNTYSNSTEVYAFLNFLKSLSVGNLVIGVSSYDAGDLNVIEKDLYDFGIEIKSLVKYGKLVFVLQIGNKANTHCVLGKTDGLSLVSNYTLSGNICLNGGNWTLGTYGYYCSCSDKYSGSFCEKDGGGPVAVSLTACGINDTKPAEYNYSRILLDGKAIINGTTNYTGIIAFNFDVCNRRGYNYYIYNTHKYKSHAKTLKERLEALPYGALLIGLSTETASDNLEPALLTLKNMGIDLYSLKYGEKCIFFIKKGYPAESFYEIKGRYGNCFEYNFSITAPCYDTKVTK